MAALPTAGRNRRNSRAAEATSNANTGITSSRYLPSGKFMIENAKTATA